MRHFRLRTNYPTLSPASKFKEVQKKSIITTKRTILRTADKFWYIRLDKKGTRDRRKNVDRFSHCKMSE
jgi:hypothetical protein